MNKYKNVLVSVRLFNDCCYDTLEEFRERLTKAETELREKGVTEDLHIEATIENDYGDPSTHVSLYGYRLETEPEMETRLQKRSSSREKRIKYAMETLKDAGYSIEKEES